MTEDITGKEAEKEETNEELEKKLDQSPSYRICKRDRPTFVLPVQFRSSEEIENHIKMQKGAEANQKAEIVLNANAKLCEKLLNKNSQLSPYELMIVKANPGIIKTYTPAKLKEDIQKIKGVMEDSTNTINVSLKRKGEDAKSLNEKTGTIIHVNQMGNATSQHRIWTEFVPEIDGDVAVSKTSNRIIKPILDNYLAELATRNDKKKTSHITAKMRDTVKQAEKIKPSITKAIEKAEKARENGRQPDFKTASAYIDATTELNLLSDQYSSLKGELEHFTYEALDVPEFPVLANFDTSLDRELKQIWRSSA